MVTGWGDTAGRARGCCDPCGEGWRGCAGGAWPERGSWLTSLATGQPLFPGGPGAGWFLPGTAESTSSQSWFCLPRFRWGSACGYPGARGVQVAAPKVCPRPGVPKWGWGRGKGEGEPFYPRPGPCPSPAGFGQDGKSEPAGPAAAAPVMMGLERKLGRWLHLGAAPRPSPQGHRPWHRHWVRTAGDTGLGPLCFS